jgi:phosphoribosylformimino-5-aminoimidazole carboxamide ribotide isomerase
MTGMAAFRIVPVVDVKGGLAVHAVKGQRDTYAPVNCGWCKDGNIGSLVKGYSEIFGLHDLYVADLDAIMAGKLSKAAYKEVLARVDGEVMIDAGVTSMVDFHKITSVGFESVILGTESIPTISLLAKIIEQNKQATIVSLDVKNGAVLSPEKQLAGIRIREAFRIIEGLAPSAIIFLDMSGVGARTGINPVARELAMETSVPLYLGGGMSSASDVRRARDAGFAGVLVATALQAGLISPEEVARLVA